MKKVHLIGNAHVDLAWFWRWQEGYSEVLATFKSALDRIDEFDEFIFTCAGSAYYKFVEETDPKMFEEIKKRVKEGKWVIVGGFLLQPDCNFPSGESLSRHSLYGQNYFKEKFGITAEVGYNVDGFGHPGTLPQILKLSNLNSYVYLRPSIDIELLYPFENRTFNWIGSDGTSIPTYRIYDCYTTKGFNDLTSKCKEHIEMAEKLDEDVMMFYGVGNHGGGPTIANILSLKETMKNNKDRVIFSNPNKFFKEVDTRKLNNYSGDLHHHASGCYSVTMKTKTLNRIAEANLMAAEKASVMAKLLNVKKDIENIKDAWYETLINQFHDTMCGCCSKDAINDANRRFGHSITLAEECENRALQAITWNIDTSKGHPANLDKEYFLLWEDKDFASPFVVFNMNSYAVKAPVKFGVLTSYVEDDEHNEILCHKTRAPQTNIDNDNWQSEIVADIPAYGYKLYWLYRKKESSNVVNDNWNGLDFENDYLSIKLSNELKISSIFDKTNNKELLKGSIEHIIVDDSNSDTWSHNIFAYTNSYKNFSNGRLIHKHSDSVCQESVIEYKCDNSIIKLTIKLYKELNKLDLSYNVNYQHSNTVFKIVVPIKESGIDIASAPYGFVKRNADNKEQPMHKWLCIGNEKQGLGIINDSRSAYDYNGSTLRITAIRNASIADHYGNRDELCEDTDSGMSDFRISIIPYKNGMSEVIKESELLIKPLSVVMTSFHKGALKSSSSLINVDADNIIVKSIKKAEDEKGIILHCYETSGQDTKVNIRIDALNISFDAEFKAQQIKAFRIYEGKVSEVNFMEEDLCC